MHTKHVVFAALITLFCAGAVIAAITGLSEPISTENTPPRITLTPVSTEPTATTTTPPTEPEIATTTNSDLSTISTTSTSTLNDNQASTSLAQ